MKYVKKPIPVEAIQWFEGVEHPAVKIDWPIATLPPRYYVSTLENHQLYLTKGCWIVGPGHSGEYWPVQEEIFKATYEEYNEVLYKPMGGGTNIDAALKTLRETLETWPTNDVDSLIVFLEDGK